MRAGEPARSGLGHLAWAKGGPVALGEVGAFEAAFCTFSFPLFLHCFLLRD